MLGNIQIEVKVPKTCMECEMIDRSYSPSEYGMYFCKMGYYEADKCRKRALGYNPTKKPDWCLIKPKD